MLVWNAMPSITPMMSAIFCELSLISPIVPITRLTTSLPFSAISDALFASPLACRAFSAFCLTVAVSSSMLAAVSSSDAACCSVRCDRSWLPAAISWLAAAIDSAAWRIPPIVACRRPCMSRIAAIMLDLSPARTATGRLRSPDAIRAASAAASSGSPPRLARTLRMMTSIAAVITRPITNTTARWPTSVS
ncbi:methyl-accepting chemotaxis sensory transducer domain protein [Burkholderia sp. ABCPW 111]|nr:methyl-accepting chemotaxis sensory transducer domain protein [Burkholderia sp. ABCPW 111]